MEYKIDITEQALTDVRDIFRYIAVDLNEPTVATKMKEAILDCVDSLEVFPLRNKLVDDEEASVKGVRRAIVKNYSVFYSVTGNNILILRVLYNRREWQNFI